MVQVETGPAAVVVVVRLRRMAAALRRLGLVLLASFYASEGGGQWRRGHG
jgi:hypothetical protein